jgi:precorrin-6B methylase 2
MYTWKSTCFGADTITIYPNDDLYVKGFYKIGIYSRNQSEFKLKYSVRKMPLVLKDNLYINIAEYEYFQLFFTYEQESRIEINVLGPAAIFVSFNNLRPKVSSHEYSAGYFVDDTCTFIDPFDQYPLSFKRFNSENQVLPKEAQQNSLKSRLCFEKTDEIQKKNKCHISILNLASETKDFLITCTEILESELIPSSVTSKYNIFNSIFCNVQSNEISQKNRKSLQLSYDCEFTYGEIDFMSFGKLLDYCFITPGQVFWDLGCGTGKALVCAKIFFPSLVVKGVEYLPELYKAALNATQQLENAFVFNDDIRNIEWNDADVIFMSSVCFLDGLMDHIFMKSACLKPGSRIITLKKLPESETWDLKSYFMLKTSWGRSDCFLYIKIK